MLKKRVTLDKWMEVKVVFKIVYSNQKDFIFADPDLHTLSCLCVFFTNKDFFNNGWTTSNELHSFNKHVAGN